MMAPRRRPSMGRQKIEIRRIESQEARQVCFSKRRAGLFKKASELSILCGADVAAVVFSPAGKAFSFGHPSVESIIDRFLAAAASSSSSSSSPPPGAINGAVSELNRQYGELRAQLDAEKARRERVDGAMEKEREARSPAAAWMDAEVGAMGQHDLLAFGAALADVQVAVAARAEQLLQEALLAGTRSRSSRQITATGGGFFFDLSAGMISGVESSLLGFGGGHAFFGNGTTF
uniref:MADS-box domain-containing protein n=1 Tax=Arundo donax TaxID=35708 RepID=A0A0A8YEF0_ARUDO